MWGIELNRQSELPLKRQLYHALKDRMIGGQLASGETMVSTREMAKALNLSRNTVSEAYDMLIAEGFLLSRQGAPTRVADGLQVESPVSAARDHGPPAYQITVSFRTGRPDLGLFPRFLWQQLLHKAASELTPEAYGYTGPQGLPKLRAEIAAWLFRYRGLTVDPLDIFISAGATHALHLIADLLCRDGRNILMEDPCHSGMLQTFINKGCSIVPVPADAHGMQTHLLTDGMNAGAVYVTPSHQFPLGGILPAFRRAALIRYARENNVYIIEDDYDSEFRYGGEPIAPLHAMDPQRVIYVGTFSKVLFPALRIGYAVLPPPLQQRWRHLRTHTDVQNPPCEQAALALLLQTRKLDRHVQKMRKIYGQRRQVLLDCLKDAFGSGWQAYGDAAGLHVAVDFPGKCFDEAFHKRCLQNGIYITPVETHCIQKGAHRSMLLLGYGHLEPEDIRRGIQALQPLISEHETGR
jgi:GntR family transcriptional regulator/MocR family aminotransferase